MVSKSLQTDRALSRMVKQHVEAIDAKERVRKPVGPRAASDRFRVIVLSTTDLLPLERVYRQRRSSEYMARNRAFSEINIVLSDPDVISHTKWV